MSTSKKIAIISAVFPPYKGGIGNVAHNHARILSDRGCDVTVFTPAYARLQRRASAGLRPDYGYSSYSEKGEGVSVVWLKSIIKYGNAAYVPQLCNQLRGFDAVILEYPFFGGMKAVYKAKKKYNFKLIVFYHMDTIASGPKGMVFAYAKKFFLPRIVKIADMVAASSDDYAKHSDLRHYWMDDNKKFQVLQTGVDITKFKSAPVDEGFRKNLNIKPDEKIILFVGGLDKAHYFKGVEYLIRAASLLSLRGVSCTQRTTRQSYRRNEQESATSSVQRVDKIASSSSFAPSTELRRTPRNDTYKVVIVGRGGLQEEYRELAEKLGVKDKVLFTGGIKDEALVKLYQMAYVTILPSINQSEAFGIVLVESMACGTPVIASDLPGVRSVFEDGVTGFVSKVKDEKDLAKKISFILNDPAARDAMSKKCVQLSAEKYDWEKIGDRLEQMTKFKI